MNIKRSVKPENSTRKNFNVFSSSDQFAGPEMFQFRAKKKF